jgi:hypothetical protein
VWLQAVTVLMRWLHSGIPVSVSAEIARDGLTSVCFYFSVDFFNQEGEKLKIETNDKFFNWLLGR